MLSRQTKTWISCKVGIAVLGTINLCAIDPLMFGQVTNGAVSSTIFVNAFKGAAK